MQCDEFDVRLQKLLDRRCAPDRDAHLQHHARVCSRCRNQLAATVRLFEGLDLWEVPPLRGDFAQRVVQQVVPAVRTRPSLWPRLALAVAATLLIALLPGLGYLLRSTGPRAGNSAQTGAGGVAYATVNSTTNDPRAIDDSAWMRYSYSILELYPEATRARHRQQVSALAEDLRPIATPFNAAVTALWRTIPVGRSTDKGPPSASAAPSATGASTHA